MKKTAIILMVMLFAYSLFAVEVFLMDGREYKGELLSTKENRVILQDEGVVIQIPASHIKSIFEEGKDITADLLHQAMKSQVTDIHFLEDDEFFVSEAALGNSISVPVMTAKMLNPPTKANKMQGKFVLTGNGTQITTNNYYVTKPAALKDLKVGSIVICYESNSSEGPLRGPKSEEEKRNGNWTMSKVKSLTEVADGFIIIDSDYKVDPDNIRIITK